MSASKRKFPISKLKKGAKKVITFGKLITWGSPTEKIERTRSKKLFFVVLFLFLLRLIFAAFS
ncbi:hypothetical protein ACNZ61_002737 [Enterococcus hirae]